MTWLAISGLLLILFLVFLFSRFFQRRKRIEKELQEETERRRAVLIVEQLRTRLSERGASVREALIALPVVLVLLFIAAFFIFQKPVAAP